MNESVDKPVNPYTAWHRISDEEVEALLSPENLSQRTKRTFAGFEITDSLDGKPNNNVELSLVKVTPEGKYPQHVHKKSDAYLIVTAGEATFLSGDLRRPIKVGERLDIPRGTPHGFELKEGELLEFISFQSPPIKDEVTGEEDFHIL